MNLENGDENNRNSDNDDERSPADDNDDDEELENYFLKSMPPSDSSSGWKFKEYSSRHDVSADREIDDTAAMHSDYKYFKKSTETNENDQSINSPQSENGFEVDFAPRRDVKDNQDENPITLPTDDLTHLINSETMGLNSEDGNAKGRPNQAKSSSFQYGDKSMTNMPIQQILGEFSTDPSKIESGDHVPPALTVTESAFKATNDNPDSSTVHNMHAQDAFVKRAARVRALLTKALRAVADGFVSNTLQESVNGDMINKELDDGDKNVIGRKRGSDECVGEENVESRPVKKQWNSHWDLNHLQELAQEKSEECIILKRKLQEMESAIKNIQNENNKIEQSNARLQLKIDRTTEALQIAGTRAANSRAEADAANTRAESFSTQLNDLKSLIEETGRGMEVVRRENDEVSRAARSVEGRLIQVESELAKALRVRKAAEDERDLMKARAQMAEKKVAVLQEKVNDCRGEIRLVKKRLSEVYDVEKVRSDRFNRTETELQEARATLFHATSAAAESETTVASLRNVIEELRQENESLNTKMSEDRDGFAKDRSKHNEALTAAEKEAQMWKMKYEENEEEIRKLKLDKASADTQLDQMKTRMSKLEKRLDESNQSSSSKSSILPGMPTVTPKSSDLGVINAFGANDVTYEAQPSAQRQYVFKLPMRASPEPISESASRKLSYSSSKPSNFSGKEQLRKSLFQQLQTTQSDNNYRVGEVRKAPKAGKCCICLKDFSGMMKSCQCGKLKCDKRAHASCVMKSKKVGAIRSGILCEEGE